MGAGEGKFIITAQNRIKEGLDPAKQDLLGFEDAAKHVGDTLKNALTVTAIVAGLKKLGETAFECFKEFGESERRLNSLKIALDNNETSFGRMTGLIGDMHKMSLASKDDIEGLVAELAMLGKSDKEIEAITKASVNLSNVTGKDLNSAFTLINGTYTGTAGKLEKLIPEIGDLSKKQLEAGEATDLINTKFGEMSAKLAENDIPQKLKNLKDSFRELKENLGAQTASFFSPIVAGIQTVVQAWNDAFKAQNEYKKNVLTIKDVETKSEGDRLMAALANAKRDQEKWYQSWRLSMLNTPGLWKMVGGQATPIYTPQQSYDMGFFQDQLKNYFGSQAMVASFQISLENFAKENPGWNAPRPIIAGGTGGTGKTDEKFEDKVIAALEAGNTDKLYDYFNSSEINKFPDLLRQIVKFFTPGPFSQNGVGFMSATFADDVGVRISDILAKDLPIALVNIGNMGQSAIPGPLGAGGTSIYDQVWKDIVEGMQSEFATRTGAMGQSGISPIGISGQTFSPRDDFYEQLVSDLNLSSNQLADESGAIAFGKEVRAGMQAYLGNQTLEAALQGMWDNAINDLAAEYAGKPGAMGQSGIVPEGFSNAMVDILDQLSGQLDDLQKEFTKPQYGQSAIPGPLGAGGTSVSEQIANFSSILSDLRPAMIAFENGNNFELSGQEPNLTVFEQTLADISSGMTDAFDRATWGLNDFSFSISDSLGTILNALGPFGNMIAGMNPALALLMPSIKGFVDVIGPALTEALEPITQTLTSLGQTLGSMLLPVLDAISPVFALLGETLQTVLLPVIQLLTPALQIVASLFDALTPILKLVAQAFTIIMAPVEYVADLFSWVGEWIKTLGTNIGVFVYNLSHWFNPKDYVSGPGSFVSDAFSGLADKLAAIDLIGGTSLASAYSTSTQTATESAAYRTQNITINIYQEAPIVGSGGMTEFARMIRGELESLAYYGT